jgi:hypothetical protein
MCDPCTILLLSNLSNQTLPRAVIDDYVQFEFASNDFRTGPALLDTPQLAVSSATLGHIYVYFVFANPINRPSSIKVTLNVTTPSPNSTTNSYSFDIPSSFGNNSISGSNVFIGTLNAPLIPGSILTINVTSAIVTLLSPIVVALGP